MDLPFGMNETEGSLFSKHLKNCSGYLEFGCGGSTRLAISLGVETIHSVETDPEWIAGLRSEESVAAALASGKLTFHSRELGKVGKWGFPKDRAFVDAWPYFSMGVWTEIDVPIDFVFVDGRFRVAAAISGFLMAESGSIVAIHDFSGREYYQPVLEFGEVLEKVNNSIYLQRAENVSDTDLVRALYKFMFDPR